MPSIRNNEFDNQRKKVIEAYVIDVNNKLSELVAYLNLDLPEIKKINKERYGSEKQFNDSTKKSIIDSIKIFEEINKDEDELKKQVDLELNRQKTKRMLDMVRGLKTNNIESSKSTSTHSTIASKSNSPYSTIVSESINKSSTGVAPPKTDWKRMDVSNDEKNKILESIRANPKSSVFSKEFKWNMKDFLGAFSYLEESSKYNGPFLTSIIDTKEKLENFSDIKVLYDKIPQIYLGKFVLLSMYDITASAGEAKQIFVGLKYDGMTGRLEFDCMGSMNEAKIKNYQKKLLLEYFDSMEIVYKASNEDLKLS